MMKAFRTGVKHNKINKKIIPTFPMAEDAEAFAANFSWYFITAFSIGCYNLFDQWNESLEKAASLVAT